MTNDEIRELLQRLRAEGVKRARFTGNDRLAFVEFFEQAAGMPTDAEKSVASAAHEEKTGHEIALDLLLTGSVTQRSEA